MGAYQVGNGPGQKGSGPGLQGNGPGQQGRGPGRQGGGQVCRHGVPVDPKTVHHTMKGGITIRSK